jgi:heme/copper-type cytochrome/quinol oxidase subunit 3
MPTFLATRHQRGMAIFLCADFAIFLALFFSYLYMRHQTPLWPAAFHFASGLVAFAITLFTLAGSFAMVFSVRYQVKQGSDNNYEISMRLILATIAVFGSAFILIFMEWVRLILISEVTFTANPWLVPAFSWTYFSLTGFYAVHLVAAIVYLTVVAAKIKTSDAGSAALFVHLTNLVWLFIFVGVYFASTDLQGL